MIITITLLTSCVKLLLIPAYRSTDFEVHRNWLALTNKLPVEKWYFEDTSEWTLDYPPLFAWFEYLLSLFAQLFDKNMLQVDNLNYASQRTVVFQRLSVILTDLVYAYGVYKCCSSFKNSRKTQVVLPILFITNCGLIMLDHIHFQYNGVMYGILLISLAHMFEGQFYKSAFWFTILINMKHIYIYLAPVYFVYLLRHCCLSSREVSVKSIFRKNVFQRFATLGVIVLSVFFVTFVPFRNQLGQVLSRLFPFKRGLCHAYWAPNFWAIYTAVDKILFFTCAKFGLIHRENIQASMTGGLVQESSHLLLPNVHPIVTMLITFLCLLPTLFKLFMINAANRETHFTRAVVISALTSFLFGWHVHEKAILMAIIPLTLLTLSMKVDAKIYLILSIIGHYSLFPLLFPPSLLVIKVLLLLSHTIYICYVLHKMYPLGVYEYSLPRLAPIESLYTLGLTLVFFYENVVQHLLGLSDKLPFLPLMITSVYCAIGVLYCWVKYCLYFWCTNFDKRSTSNKGR